MNLALLTMAILSSIGFSLSVFYTICMHMKEREVPPFYAFFIVIFIICVWKYVLFLGIIAIFLGCVMLFIDYNASSNN